jgi:hypothetical protein
MKCAWFGALLFALGVVACKSSSSGPTTSSSGPTTRQTPANDCTNYEHQVDLCRAQCPDCSASTPGNACNVCAEGCADRIYCNECKITEHCAK